jgi:phosphate transport system permease protein
LGEAAPLLLVGAVGERLADNHGFFDPSQLQDSFTALPIAITDWTKRPLNSGFFELSAAAIIVMLVIVLFANSVAIVFRNRFEKRRG